MTPERFARLFKVDQPKVDCFDDYIDPDTGEKIRLSGLEVAVLEHDFKNLYAGVNHKGGHVSFEDVVPKPLTKADLKRLLDLAVEELNEGYYGGGR